MVDFNANFGYNVRNYQQMKQMSFGNNIRAGFNPQNTMYSMNASLFKFDGNVGNANFFAGVKTNQNFNFNGVNYDNAYAMLNSVGDGGGKSGGIDFAKLKDTLVSVAGKVGDFLDKGFDKIGETFGKIGKTIGDTATKAFNGIKEGVGKLFGKKDKPQADNVGKALDEMKNAQDKETLSKAVEGAKVEQKANTEQIATAEKAEKTAEKGKAEADKKADSSAKKLDGDKKQLDNDKGALEQAKTDVATAKTNLEAATQGVASAQQALDSAKSAATSENPNTVAIQNAEQQLKLAKEKETQAKNDLEAKEKALDGAQKQVDSQTETVKNSEQENKQAQEGVKKSDAEVKSAQQQTQTVQTQGQQINEGVAEGEQRLEQMSGDETQATATSRSQETPNATGANNAENSIMLPQSDDPQLNATTQYLNDDMDVNNLTPEQRAKVLEDYNKLNNLQPGQTVEINGEKYTMDSNGLINGESKSDTMLGACSTSINKADASNRQEKFDKVAEEYKQLDAKPNKTPEDRKLMQSKMQYMQALAFRGGINDSALYN